jgi:hypothetical protein
MAQFPRFKSLTFAVAALLATSISSAVMAQNAMLNPGNTQAGSSSGQDPSGQPWPIYGQVQYGQYGASAGSGNGAGFVAAGTGSQGHYSATGVTTQAPGDACSTLPGTDISYDCAAW